MLWSCKRTVGEMHASQIIFTAYNIEIKSYIKHKYYIYPNNSSYMLFVVLNIT